MSPELGFPPGKRLLDSAQFGHVFAKPRRSSDQYFTILARRGGSDTARLGLTVGKRVAPRAVDRNRIKRIVRETFRQHPHLPLWDFVVIARPMAQQANNETLRASLDRHFERLTAARER